MFGMTTGLSLTACFTMRFEGPDSSISLAHCVQVVGSRNHGEQQHQNATQEQEGTNPMQATSVGKANRFVAPHPDSGQGQGQPNDIEQQFHRDRNSLNEVKAPQQAHLNLQIN